MTVSGVGFIEYYAGWLIAVKYVIPQLIGGIALLGTRNLSDINPEIFFEQSLDWYDNILLALRTSNNAIINIIQWALKLLSATLGIDISDRDQSVVTSLVGLLVKEIFNYMQRSKFDIEKQFKKNKQKKKKTPPAVNTVIMSVSSAIEVGKGTIQSIWWIFEYLPCIIAHFIRSLLNDDLAFFISST